MPKFFCMPFFACNRQVDSLDKRQCNLQMIPNDIERYSRSLEELLLDMNHIKDLPKSLFRLHKLQKLGLSDNDVYRIPPEVAQLTNLMELNVSRNDISDIPDELRGCKNLRVLDISSNPIARLPDSISQVVSLTHLNLNDTSLTKLPQDLGHLSNLRSLEVRENHLHSLPNTLSMLVNLQRLDIGQNELDELPNEIHALISLQELYVDENHLEDLPEGILNCKNLEQMDLSSNKLMKLPENIGELNRLTDLTLSQNCVQSLPHSIRHLKRLNILKVDNNNLSTLTQAIGSCSELTELYLMYNLLQELPSTISNLKKLVTLNVDKNHLTSVPSLIGHCESLAVLSLRDNQLKELPMEIGKLEKLRVLDLCNNLLHFLPFTINVLFNLQALWLSENQSQALLKFQQTQDPATQMRVLTCYLLPQQSAPSSEPKTSGKAFIGGPKVHFGGMDGEVTLDEDGQPLQGAIGNFERHDTPHPKPNQGGRVKKASIDGHVIHHGDEQSHPTNLALTRKVSEDRPSDHSTGPRSALKHPSVHQPFSESTTEASDSSRLPVSAAIASRRAVVFQTSNGAVPVNSGLDEEYAECRLRRINTPHYKSLRSDSSSGTLLRPQGTEHQRPEPPPSTTTHASGLGTRMPQPPSVLDLDQGVKRIVIRRSANAGLGLSIAGGVESTPFVENDCGLFVSKLTPDGAAERAGLRVGDKLLDVNGTNMVNQRHDVAVQCMQKATETVVMMVQRETSPMIERLDAEIRAGSSSANCSRESNIISAPILRDSKGSPGFSLSLLDGKEAVITALKPGGAAERDGKLRVGDVIVSVNNTSVRGMNLDQISKLITQSDPDAVIILHRKSSAMEPPQCTVFHNPSIDNTVDVVELERDENHSLGLSIVGGIDHCSHPFGVNDPGVFISKIAPNSPAAALGKLRIGDRILSVNKEVVEKAKHNDAVTVLKNTGKHLVLTVRHEPQPKGLREITFRRRKGEPIGLSICGGISSPPANPHDPTDEGIFVEKIEKGSCADACGFLRPGMRVLEINEDSLLGCTQPEAANQFRRAENVIRLLVCDGFSTEPKTISSIIEAPASFPPRKTPEQYLHQVPLPKPTFASTGIPLNFNDPPVAASSPIPTTSQMLPTLGSPATATNGLNNSYQNASASTSFASINLNNNNNHKISSPTQITTTFRTAPPPVAPKPKTIPVEVSVEPHDPPESLNFSSKLRRFESEITAQTRSGGTNGRGVGSVSASSLPEKKPLVVESELTKMHEEEHRKPSPSFPLSPASPETSMEQLLNTSIGSLSLPQVVRTKKAENRLAAASPPAISSPISGGEPLNSVEQHDLDIKKRHEWRQARLASLDAETQRADQLMQQLSAKRLAQISEERSVSASPTAGRVLHNESSVENFTTLDAANGAKTVSMVETSITQREFDLSGRALADLQFADD